MVSWQTRNRQGCGDSRRAGNRFDKTCFYAPYRNDVNKSPGYDHDDMFCRDYSAADSFWKTQTSRGVYRDYHTFMCAKAIAPA